MVSERIKTLRNKLGIKQPELGRLAGVSKAAVSQWERGLAEPQRDALLELQRKRSVNPLWVARGEGRMFLQAGIDDRHRAPLISWSAVGSWPGVIEDQLPDVNNILCPIRTGPNTYALRVQGDAMTAPHGRSYPDGAIIFVDPDQTESAADGDSVIAELLPGDQVTFRTLVDDGANRYLRALNPAYLPITQDFEVLGKVVGMWVEG